MKEVIQTKRKRDGSTLYLCKKEKTTNTSKYADKNKEQMAVTVRQLVNKNRSLGGKMLRILVTKDVLGLPDVFEIKTV